MRDLCARPGCFRSADAGRYCDGCRARAARAGYRITLVAGPPCSGKSTYVAQHRGPRDLVLDVDALRVALGGDVTHTEDGALWLPFVCAARDAVLQRLGEGHGFDRVWIISCAPRRCQRDVIPGALVKVLDTAADVCHQRADAERPVIWHELIDQWFTEYEP